MCLILLECSLHSSGGSKSFSKWGAWSLKSGINSRDNSEAHYYMIMEDLEIFTLLYVYDCFLNGK